MRYFVERATRWQVQRYHLLMGNQVVRIQASRPDGTEVPRPWNVVYRVSQPGPASAPKRRGIATYNRDFMRPTEQTRSCLRCGQIKPIADFNRSSVGRWHTYCRDCMRDYERARRARKTKEIAHA
jgi:hypothetical protein